MVGIMDSAYLNYYRTMYTLMDCYMYSLYAEYITEGKCPENINSLIKEKSTILFAIHRIKNNDETYLKETAKPL